MAEQTNNNPIIGFARDDKSNTTRNLQLGREELQRVGAAANHKQNNGNLMEGERSLKWKEQRRKVANDLQREGERIYSAEELKNLPEPPIAALFNEDNKSAALPFAEEQGQGQKRRGRRRRGGRRGGNNNNNNNAGDQASVNPRTVEAAGPGVNLQWVPKEPNFRAKGRGRAKATPSQPSEMEKTQIKGSQQVMNQGGRAIIQEQQQAQQGQQQQGGQRRRNRRRRGGRGGKQQQQQGGGDKQQTLGDKVADKGNDLAEQASAKMGGMSIDGDMIKEKGKQWSEQAGEFIDSNMPKAFEAKEGEKSLGDKVAETGKEWSKKAASMTGDQKIDGDKLESKAKEIADSAGEMIDSKSDSSSSLSSESSGPIDSMKSLAGEIVEQASEKMSDIKDAALSTFGFDSSTSSSTSEKRIDSDQKEVASGGGDDLKDNIDSGDKSTESEGILGSAKGMFANALETVKEKAGDAIDFVAEKASDMGLTLEPSLSSDDSSSSSGGDNAKGEQKMNDDSGMKSDSGKMDSVQPVSI